MSVVRTARGLARRIARGGGFIAVSASFVLVAAAVGPVEVEAQAPTGFMTEFEGQFDGSARKLVSLAEAMPASAYDWSPGEGVASVARVFMHIARYNYMYPHENMGRETPVPPAEYRRWEDEVSDKDRVVEILAASMEYVWTVAEAMDTSSLDRQTELYGRDVGEWAVMLQLVTHMNEHLGQSIAYARMNGIVPPWSN